jgi:hypothetical protein
MPKDYFDGSATELLADFREAVRSDRQEELIEGFPEAAVAGTLQKTWHSSAIAIYRNWLCYVISNKRDIPEFSALAAERGMSSERDPLCGEKNTEY